MALIKSNKISYVLSHRSDHCILDKDKQHLSTRSLVFVYSAVSERQ